jgi:hypothetical protein
MQHERERRLKETIGWAAKLRATLHPILEACGDRVHFRPSSSGVSMIGLLPNAPQLGMEPVQNLDRLARDFEMLFARHCEKLAPGRDTPEKALQSFLIRDAYARGRHMDAIRRASTDATDLIFVTDEISLPTITGERKCDLLALRRDGARWVPVLIELKSRRAQKELVEQVTVYARLIDEHAALFSELYSALLGEPVVLDQPTEKWIVWPSAGIGPDPREAELGAIGIRVVGYDEIAGSHKFIVGPPPRPMDSRT